jgi:hypothetical protein
MLAKPANGFGSLVGNKRFMPAFISIHIPFLLTAHWAAGVQSSAQWAVSKKGM